MQRALLDARIRLAARLGCTLVVGMTEYGTASGRNLQRAGLGLVQVRTIWTAAPPGDAPELGIRQHPPRTTMPPP